MKFLKGILVVFLSVALPMVVTTATAQAECCYFFNPFFLPFAVAGAVLGTATAIVTGFTPAPYYGYAAYQHPAYYGPPRAYYGPRAYPGESVWVPGYHNRYGGWIPGHWRDPVWIPEHYNRYGEWIPGHWG
jgi:hypothetical protein